MRLIPFLIATLALPGVIRSQTIVSAPRVTQRDLGALRWMTGDWRGAGSEGTAQAPFFERYRFVDDSTLLVESFSDSTFRELTEVSRLELRAGRLGNTSSGAQWAMVRMDGTGAEFMPVARTGNGFTWERARGDGDTPATWRATISWARPDGTSRERHYRMDRIR